MFIFYAVLILRDISKVVEDVEEVVDRVHSTIVEPLKAVDFMIASAKPYIEAFFEKKASEVKKKKD